jgi:hypothetical protein
MAHAILNLLLVFHFAIVPVFYPKPSGIHDGRLTVSNAPTWHQILHSGNLEQPDGFMVIGRFRFE